MNVKQLVRDRIKSRIKSKVLVKKPASRKADARYELVSFRVNNDELDRIKAALPDGWTLNTFARELVMKGVEDEQV